MALLAVFLLTVVVYRATTEAERATFVRDAHLRLQRWGVAASGWYQTHEAFFAGLRARTRFAPVTPAIVLVNLIMFVVVAAAGMFDGRDVLVEWGASIGPRTTNGEWWRLVTSLFVHAGPVHLLACVIGFLPVSFVVERLVGSVALAAVYVTAGVFATLAAVSLQPMAVSTGASGAVCGVYGLMVATAAWGIVRPPRLIVPWGVVKWLGAAALVFAVYNVPSGMVPLRAELIGFVVGLLCGGALGDDVARNLVPAKRSAGLVALALGMALVLAFPVRGITDARPDIDRLIATDEQLAATFRAAATRLALGRTTEKAMVDLIERQVIPALETERSRLASRRVVPEDQKPFVAAADEYVRVRIESWRLRATAFRKGSLSMLRQADSREGAARDVLARIPYPLSPT